MRLRSRTSDVVAAGFEVASPTFLDVVNTLRTVQSGFVTDGLKCVPVRGVAVFGRFFSSALGSSSTMPAGYVEGFSERGSILRAMQRISLDALATQQLELAAAHGGRPAADTVVGGHERVLRQTVVGMIKGSELGEHNNPGEATVHVLRGRVRLTSEGQSWEGRAGDLLKIPNARHGLQALEDSAILLTVAKLG